MPQYKEICGSYVAIPENPIGVVEFYGGQFFGQFPVSTYDYFLKCIYDAGYAVIAVPYKFSTDHISVAQELLHVRDCVKDAYPEIAALKFFWIGHSLGCKLIAMLEAWTDTETNQFVLPKSFNRATENMLELAGIRDQPSVLIAPVFADSKDIVPIPALAEIIDGLGCGVVPTRQEVRDKIQESDLFNLTGVICFEEDEIAGHFNSDPADKDVPWLIKKLSKPGRADEFYKKELPGGHLKPNGCYCCEHIFGVHMASNMLILPTVYPAPRDLEPVVLNMLKKLGDDA